VTAPPGPRAELLRRILLGLVTALIVVRALVPGEDVGLLEPGANPIGLLVPLLWLCGLAAWAAWRSLSRQLDWYGGLVESGLLVVVLFSFISTAWVASYQHPAWVVSWEWAGLLAAFFLVRQVARSESDQRGILAVLLAVGVCLAVQSVYQHALPDRGRAPLPGLTADELPRRRCELLATLGSAPQNAFPGNLSLGALAAATSERDPTLFERIAARNNVRLETGEPALPLGLRPRPAEPPAATFGSESNLAGYLALVLPALAGCALAAWLGGAPRWQLAVAVGCTALTALALWLTQVQSAIVPCLLVGAAVSALAWRYQATRPAGAPGPSRRVLLALALASLGALLALAFVVRSPGGQGFDDLTREWSAAWAMIREHVWLGVGPGNYGRHYPKYMAPTAPAFATQPDNFALEIWATLGLPALLGLGLALVNFFRRTLAVVQRSQSSVPGWEQGTDDEPEGTRWEFYEGGMAGLLVGFVFRALRLDSPEAIPAEAVAAGVRAVVWFAAFALLSGIRWGGPTRVLACTAGVAALLLHLAFAGGMSVAGVVQPLLIMAALALNGLPEKPLPIGRQFVGRVLPLALATAAVLLCALQLVLPLMAGASASRSALASGQKYLDVRSGVTRSLDEGKTERLRHHPAKVVADIIEELEKAVEEDPANAAYWVDLANWYTELYALAVARSADEAGRYDEYRRRALEWALAAQKRDPLGVGGYLAESRLHQITVRRAATVKLEADAATYVAVPLSKLVEHRPNDAQLHYQLAVACFAERVPRTVLGRHHAERALELDRQAPTPQRRLSDAQRRQAERFATDSPQRRLLP
jgi:O-antigen ligase